VLAAYGLPVRTTDAATYPVRGRLDDILPHAQGVAREQGLAPDWINPHYETFAHVLPADYSSRLREIFAGDRLRAMALGVEDLLVMKCFAGREKDVGHARALPMLTRSRHRRAPHRGAAGARRPRGPGRRRFPGRSAGGRMTPLDDVPSSSSDVARLYHELGRLGARTEGKPAPWRWGRPSPEETLVLAVQAARHDPRLLWVAVELLAKGFDPLKLRRAAQRSRWPAALGVAFEFARAVARTEELDDVARFVLAPVAPARGERFFKGTRAFAGALARRDVEESLAEYKRWGYFGRGEPLAKELGTQARGTLGRTERLNVLRRLAGRGGPFTIAEYLAALRGRASRRQAARDLATAPFLARTGATRAARYRLCSPGASPFAPA
jgi:hypothetical protein